STTGPHAPARWECPAPPPPRGPLLAHLPATPGPPPPTTNPTKSIPPPVPRPLPCTETRHSGTASSRCRPGLVSATPPHGKARATRGTNRGNIPDPGPALLPSPMPARRVGAAPGRPGRRPHGTAAPKHGTLSRAAGCARPPRTARPAARAPRPPLAAL